MDSTKLMSFNREMITAMRTLFETSMGAVTAMQDQTFKMLQLLQEKNADASRTAGDAMETWLGAWRKGQEHLRTMAEQSFRKAEEYLESATKASDR
jgi:hypothetical protein